MHNQFYISCPLLSPIGECVYIWFCNVIKGDPSTVTKLCDLFPAEYQMRDHVRFSSTNLI